jgi:putative NIF3 family GTP cyclohydrolase 1 type 2
MAKRAEIIAYLDGLLEIEGFGDMGPNGLQVPGAEDVSHVVTGVSAQRELFERAAEAGAELVLCHHGLFWEFAPRAIGPAMKERLRILFDADISLAAYHLPLDAHPEVGNNALICAALGFELAEPFAEHKGRPVGFVGRSAEGIPFTRVRELCAETFEQEPFVWECGPEVVRSRAVISRVPHRRDRRARHGGSARERGPLHRGRPLRDRASRDPSPRRAGGRAISRRAPFC